jgi:folate-binding protein YgfZ
MTNTPLADANTADELVNGWAPLAHEALLRLEGHDACKFLQGQTTADFGQVKALDVIPGAFCDVKGRVIADFRALILDSETIILCVTESLADLLTAHLTKYLMFSKAELNRIPEPPWGVVGSEAHHHFDVDQQLSEGNRAAAVPAGWLIPLGHQTSLLIPEDATQVEINLNNKSIDEFESAWRALACLRGEARITSSTTGKYLPQDLSYDLAGWVSFDKGCYTGQEIIARLHWRGTPKRRLYLGSAAIRQLGEGLKLVSRTDTRAVGSIVNAANHGGGSVILVEAVEGAAGQAVNIDEMEQTATINDAPVAYSSDAETS